MRGKVSKKQKLYHQPHPCERPQLASLSLAWISSSLVSSLPPFMSPAWDMSSMSPDKSELVSLLL